MRLLILFVMLGSYLVSCNFTNENRDKIQFNTTIDSIESAMESTVNFLERTRINDKYDIRSYAIDFRRNLYINGEKVDSSNLGSLLINVDSNVSPHHNNYVKDVRDFLNNILFLKRNCITGGYKEPQLNEYLFEYKDIPSGGALESREILLTSGIKNDLDYLEYNLGKHRYRLLDYRGNLALIALVPFD